MRDWIVRAMPLGAELTHYRGVQPGSLVCIADWRFPGSTDLRRVERLTREQCQGCVAVHLTKPLQNGSTTVAFGWVGRSE